LKAVKLSIDDTTRSQLRIDEKELEAFILKKSVEFTSAKNIQHKLDNPIGAIGTI